MSKKQNLLLALAVLVIAAGVYFLVMNKKSDSPSAGTPTGGAKTETTAKAGTYACEGGKTFTLATRADGTARVTGASSSSVVLRKSSAGIWISDDARVAVREIAGYTILVENDVTTRDRCTLR